MRVELRHQPFEPSAELARYQATALAGRRDYGATASFIGTMRDFNDGQTVSAMTLEHYPGMTEAHLTRISEQAAIRWPLLDTLIVHRVGYVQPGEPIVLVAAWSAHRAAAFDACRYLIEELKSRAPFWKQEQHGAARRWVEHNTAAV